MRKQYHFRPSKNGFFAWDVDALIMSSVDVPAKFIALSSIKEIDENYWFSHGTVPNAKAIIEHFQLMEQAELSYPIILCSNGRLMDGMHRVLKSLKEGRDKILAKQFDETPAPSFIDVYPDDLPY